MVTLIPEPTQIIKRYTEEELAEIRSVGESYCRSRRCPNCLSSKNSTILNPCGKKPLNIKLYCPVCEISWLNGEVFDEICYFYEPGLWFNARK